METLAAFNEIAAPLDIHIEKGHGALLSSGHPVFPGFNGAGLSFRIDRGGRPAATYAISTLFLGELNLRQYLEGHAWTGVEHDTIILRDEAAGLAESVTGSVGFIGGLWVRPDLRQSDFSAWCTVDLPTFAMKECDRRHDLDAYFFFVKKPRIGEGAGPDRMTGTVWWHRATEEAETPPRYLGVISRENVKRRPDPASAPR